MTAEQTTSSSHQADAVILQASLELVAPAAGELIASFYDRLFTEHPAVRPLFPPQMDLQREKLLTAIVGLVTDYDRPDTLRPALEALGARHEAYGAQVEHYAAVGACLLATLREFAGDAFTPEVEAAWTRCYTFAAGTMMQGAALAATESRAA